MMYNELVVNHGISIENFAIWLTSSKARHFCDMIEDLVYENNKNSVRKVIKYYANVIHDTAYIYSSGEHGGTWGSTVKLYNKYKELGIMKTDSLSYDFTIPLQLLNS